VKDINLGAPGSIFYDVRTAAGRAYFQADDGLHGAELWTSDGTAEGTVLVADLIPGPDPSGPHSFVSMGSRLYFSFYEPSYGAELWAYETTPRRNR
jgi:ELWxxDGT repeat protein